MALGSLLDAGADLDEVQRLLERLPIGGWGLDAETVMRGGLVRDAGHSSRSTTTASTRTFPHILGDPRRGAPAAAGRIDERWTRSPRSPRSRAASTTGRRAEVHFHELGGHDTIIDIVGTAAALELLGVDEVTVEPGGDRARHGAQPPRPAPEPRTSGRRAARAARRSTAATSTSS